MNNQQCSYHDIFTTSRKFYHEIFILEQNSRNHKSFLPQKFRAIWHTDSNSVHWHEAMQLHAISLAVQNQSFTKLYRLG